MKRALEIVIAGGGSAGLYAAARLFQAGGERLKITVVDGGDAPRFDPADDVALRVLAIAPGSAAMLDRVGAWEKIIGTRACPFDHMRVWDEAEPPDSAATLRFDADEFAMAHLGHIVENVLVQQALFDVVGEMDVQTCYGQAITTVADDADRWMLTLADGRTLAADILIGADGGRSFVREALSFDVEDRRYEQFAFVTHLLPEQPHGNAARQRFLRDGPLGMLPLSDGRITIIWSTTTANVDVAMAADDAELGAMITEVSAGALGNLAVAGSRGRFPLAAIHARHYVRRGVALIGDAAHTIHPLAGQGANLGLQDAEALASVVGAALDAGENPADRPVLRRYERARRGPNAAMMHLMTGLNSLFASDSAVLGELRRSGMRLFNRAGPVRNRIVGVALGTDRQ